MEANKTLLRMKFARIIDEFAAMMQINQVEAMRLFYASRTFMLISNGIADMHCRSDYYLADELRRELAHDKQSS